MDDFLNIKKHVARYIQLTEEEENYFTSLLRIINVKKKQFIVNLNIFFPFSSTVIAANKISIFPVVMGSVGIHLQENT